LPQRHFLGHNPAVANEVTSDVDGASQETRSAKSRQVLDPQLKRAMPVFTPLVTIGITTYNRAEGYLPLSLRSALVQDYPNLEIIVSDNASTDGTEALVRGMSDPRMRYFRHSQNVGPVNCANSCLTQAAGTYFLLLHDDDLIDPDFISTCIHATDSRADLGLVRTGIRIINSTGDTIGQKENLASDLPATELFRAWFQGKTPFYMPNTLYHTRKLREIGGFHSARNLFDDVVVLVKLAAAHDRADVRQIKASFRRHDANTCGNYNLALDWAADCVYLRDLLVELSPLDQREIIRRESTRYLCRTAFLHARDIPGRIKRVRACSKIHAMFGYTVSPLQFMFPTAHSTLRWGVHRVRRFLPGTQRATHVF
jgi:glycosyltransferase involved in cell wall biosynthesis